jgi:hypothetical protein
MRWDFSDGMFILNVFCYYLKVSLIVFGYYLEVCN